MFRNEENCLFNQPKNPIKHQRPLPLPWKRGMRQMKLGIVRSRVR